MALWRQHVLHHLLSINEWDERLPCADPLARCSSMLILASCSRCPEPLEAVPSTPSPTLTPARRSAFSGAMPAAHLLLLCLASVSPSSGPGAAIHTSNNSWSSQRKEQKQTYTRGNTQHAKANKRHS